MAKQKIIKHTILSLFDHSGSWPSFYKKAGYNIVCIDIKNGIDVLTWDYKAIDKNTVAGILAAVPCTDFSVSGAQYWKRKDETGVTAYSVSLVKKALEIIKYFKPFFWAIENPVGRINKLVPEIGKPWYFNPCDFGDPWTKKTGLFGVFNIPSKNVINPINWSDQGSWTQLLGGKSEKTKALRSITPAQFAYSFFKANNPLGLLIPGEVLNYFGRCKFGMWTCDFAVSELMCNICDCGDNYEENSFAMELENEEDFMKAVFNKGDGLYQSIDPKHLYKW